MKLLTSCILFFYSLTIIAQPHNFNAPIVLGYFPSWSETVAIQDQNSSLREIPSYVNYVFLAFAKPDLTYTKGSYDITNTGIQVPYDGCALYESVNVLKDKGVNVILSIGGETYWGSPTVYDDIDYQMIKDLVDDMGFAGIDWDYEPNGSFSTIGDPANIQHYIDFFTNSRALMPKIDGYILACAPSGVGALGGQTNDDVASPFAFGQRNVVTGEDDTNLYDGTASTNGINLFGYTATGHMIPVLQAVGADIDIVAFQGYNVGGSLNRTIMYDAYSFYAEQYGFKIAAGTHFPDEAWGPYFEYTHDNVADLGEYIFTHVDRAGKSDGIMTWQMLLDEAPTRSAYSYLNVASKTLNGTAKATAVIDANTYAMEPYAGGAVVCAAIPPVRNTVDVIACNTYDSPSGRYTWAISGSYDDTLTSQAGGDSILTINLTIGFDDQIAFAEETCANPYISPSGKEWSTAGTYMDTISTILGCDSVLTIDLTFIAPTTRNIYLTGCDSIIAPSGKVFYNAGVFSDTLNCDSIFTVYAGITKTSFNPIEIHACETYTSPSARYTWTTIGIYQDTLTAIITGCDSVLVIDLIIHVPGSFNIAMFGCDSIVSPSGRHVWKFSGNYRDTLFNPAGCDSIMLVDADVYRTPTTYFDTTYCKPITSPSGRYVWDEDGIYKDTVQTNRGCDSIIVTRVEIGAVDTSITHANKLLLSGADIAEFQWLDCWKNYQIIPGEFYKVYTVSQDGSYAVEVSQYNCVDTSRCMTVLISDIAEANPNQFVARQIGDEVHVILGNITEVAFTMFTIGGQQITTQTINTSGVLNLPSLPSGMYVLKFESSQGVQTMQVILE
jgi:hypothetical protein